MPGVHIFFKRGNLQSTRRRSASCPNLEQVSSRDTFIDSAEDGPKEELSSDSEPDVKEKPSKLERLQAQRSVRRMRQKEKEKTENSLKNLLSMDDYLSKLSELKTWLREEKLKEPDNMQSPKLKVHFKTFIRLWNKRKLPAKYYRTCSVDLEAADCTLDLDTEALEDSATPRYPLPEEPQIMSPVFLAQIVDLSPGNALDKEDPKSLDFNNAVDSPFSTFGKVSALETDELTFAMAQKNETPKTISDQHNFQAKKEGFCTKQGAQYDQPSKISPTKFATISRCTPTRSTLRSSPSPVSRLTSHARLCRVASPQCPPVISPGKFSTRPLPETPAGRKAISEENKDVSHIDREQLVAGWNCATKQSPVYSCIKDAIPYSSGSPKYAEIDESGVPQIILTGRDTKTIDDNSLARRFLSSQQLDSDYCSLSPPSENQVFSPKKKTVVLKPSFNRRRSKSMEDIYAMPFIAVPLSERKLAFLNEESSCEENSEPPPVPDRNFSPQSLFQSFLTLRNRKITPQKSYSPNETTESSSAVHLNTFNNKTEDGPQKRRSQENCETSINTSPPKKVKCESSIQDDMHKNVLCLDDLEGSAHLTQQTLGENCESETPTKLSILTGSLKPTTRSARRAANTSSLSNCKANTNPPTEDKDKNGLGVLEVKQLEESPKFLRRKLKRRSSSFSVTPGKGLTFGKSTKMTTSSPRRVSFAKDVKDTESQSTPRRRSSTRRTVVPLGGVNVTRQTQESINFQSFLSSHTSPVKGKVIPKETNVSKPPSPIKTSLTNLLGNLKKKTENNAGVPTLSTRDAETNSSEGSEITPEASSFAQRSPIKIKPPSHQLKASGNIFPPSPTRQVGRRITGSPIKCAPSNGHSYQLHTLSDGNTSIKLKENAVSQLSKKPIHAFVAKLSSKTSFLCSEEVGDSDDCSSNDELLDQKFKSESNTGNVEGPCESFDNQPIYSLHEDRKHSFNAEKDQSIRMEASNVSPQLKMTSPRTFTDGPVLRFDMTPEKQDEFMPHVKLDHGFEEQSRAGDVKAFARVAKIWNRTVGFDASVDPFVRKTKNTATVTNKSNAHNVSAPPKGRVFHKAGNIENKSRIVSKSDTGREVHRKDTEKKVKRTQVLEGHPIFSNSNVGKSNPVVRQLLTVCDDLHQESSNNCNTNSQIQAQDERRNVSNLNPEPPFAEKSSLKNDTNLDFTLPPYPENRGEDKEIEQGIVDIPCSFPPPQNELSFTLPPYPENCQVSYDDASLVETTFSNVPCPAPQSRKRRSSFPLPPCPEELKLMIDGNKLETDQVVSASSTLTDLCATGHSCLPESTSSNYVFKKSTNISSSLTPNSEVPTPNVEKEVDVEMKDSQLGLTTHLRKIESLRKASPKVVENDSWITERRQSNRSSKGHQSFQSESNHFSIQFSTKHLVNMETSSDTLDQRSQEFTDSLVSSKESINAPTVGKAEVKLSPKLKAPVHDLTPTQKSVITKPATLPKTSKAMNLSQKRLNIQNFIGSSKAPTRPVAKRRSSLTKGQPNKTNSRQDFITRNINAVKKEANRPTGFASSASTTTIATDTHTESTTRHIAKEGKERQTTCRSEKTMSSIENSPMTSKMIPNKLSVLTHASNVSLKKSSTARNIISTENRRRRSRSCGVDEENKMSFSERQRFFQQLQGNKPQSQMKSETPFSRPNKLSVFGSRVNDLTSTPRSMRSQTRDLQDSNRLVLSPKLNLEI